MQCQTTKQGQENLTWLEEQLEILKTAKKEASEQFLQGSSESHQTLLSLKNKNTNIQKELSVSVDKWTSQLDSTHAKLAASYLDLKMLCGKADFVK